MIWGKVKKHLNFDRQLSYVLAAACLISPVYFNLNKEIFFTLALILFVAGVFRPIIFSPLSCLINYVSRYLAIVVSTLIFGSVYLIFITAGRLPRVLLRPKRSGALTPENVKPKWQTEDAKVDLEYFKRMY